MGLATFRGGVLAGLAAAFLLSRAALAQTPDLRSETLYIDSVPAQSAQALAKLRAYVAATKAEPGLLTIRLLSELNRPERLAVYEVWRDEPALNAHLAATPRKALDNDLVLMLQAPIDNRIASVVTSANGVNNKSALHIIVHIDVAPPAAPAIAEALKAQVAKAGLAQGLIGYEVSQQNDHTNHFSVVQTWSGRPAFQAFAGWPAAKALRSQLSTVNGALYDERLYQER